MTPSGDRLAVQQHPVDPPIAALLAVAADGSEILGARSCADETTMPITLLDGLSHLTSSAL